MPCGPPPSISTTSAWMLLTAPPAATGGMEYLADVQSETYFAQATDRKALFKHMATIPRYAAAMREARGRVYTQRVIEKAAGRHTPR